jgi:hypothetical protein
MVASAPDSLPKLSIDYTRQGPDRQFQPENEHLTRIARITGSPGKEGESRTAAPADTETGLIRPFAPGLRRFYANAVPSLRVRR